jgi:hypothetical protein
LPCLHFYFKLLHFLTLQKCIFSHTCYFQEQARKGPTQNTPIGCQTTTSALQRHRFSHLTSLAFGISFLEMSLYLCVLFLSHYLIISSHLISYRLISSHVLSSRLSLPQLLSAHLLSALPSSSQLISSLLNSSQLVSALLSSPQLFAAHINSTYFSV